MDDSICPISARRIAQQGPEAHFQMPIHHLVQLCCGDERVKPVQQQFSHGWARMVLVSGQQPPLDDVRLVGV